MSGYVSGGSSVVLRHGFDGVVWGFRAAGSGRRPAPACLFVPVNDFVYGSSLASSVSRSFGWRCWVRRARRCSSVFECKVALPADVSASDARSALDVLGVC